jgi:hypothetical protein
MLTPQFKPDRLGYWWECTKLHMNIVPQILRARWRQLFVRVRHQILSGPFKVHWWRKAKRWTGPRDKKGNSGARGLPRQLNIFWKLEWEALDVFFNRFLASVLRPLTRCGSSLCTAQAESGRPNHFLFNFCKTPTIVIKVLPSWWAISSAANIERPT